MSRTTLLRSVAVIAVFAGLPLYWSAFPPRLPIGAADGTYANPCCGSLRLDRGQMLFGRRRIIGYVIEHDKIGRYVLANHYVGGYDDKAFEFYASHDSLMLRLDVATRPRNIELFDKAATLDFKRVEANGS